MLKCTLFLVICLLVLSSYKVEAGLPFTTGNLVVYRVGTGVAISNNIATAVFLDEYTTAGAPAQSVPMPTSSSGGNNILTALNTNNEGQMTRSINGKYLLIPGYNAAPGTTVSSSINRVVGTADDTATIDTTTSLPTSGTSGLNSAIRSASSTDGTSIWIASGNKILYVQKAGSSAIVLNQNSRGLAIRNGRLYLASSATGNTGIIPVGTGLPTSSVSSSSVLINTLTSSPAATSPSSFDFYNDNTVYIADDSTGSGGIFKYTYSSSWSLAYRLSVGASTGARGLAVTTDSSGNPVIYATTTTNSIVKIVDTGAGSSFTVLATAASNTLFRGITFAPTTLFQMTVLAVGGSCASLGFQFQEYDSCSSFKATTDVISVNCYPNAAADKFDVFVTSVSGNNKIYQVSLTAPSGATIVSFVENTLQKAFASLNTPTSPTTLTCSTDYCTGTKFVSNCVTTTPLNTFANVADVSSSPVTSFLLQVGSPTSPDLCKNGQTCCPSCP